MFTVQVSNVLCTLRGGKSHSFQAFRQWKGHEKKNETGKKAQGTGGEGGEQGYSAPTKTGLLGELNFSMPSSPCTPHDNRTNGTC